MRASWELDRSYIWQFTVFRTFLFMESGVSAFSCGNRLNQNWYWEWQIIIMSLLELCFVLQPEGWGGGRVFNLFSNMPGRLCQKAKDNKKNDEEKRK